MHKLFIIFSHFSVSWNASTNLAYVDFNSPLLSFLSGLAFSNNHCRLIIWSVAISIIFMKDHLTLFSAIIIWVIVYENFTSLTFNNFTFLCEA